MRWMADAHCPLPSSSGCTASEQRVPSGCQWRDNRIPPLRPFLRPEVRKTRPKRASLTGAATALGRNGRGMAAHRHLDLAVISIAR